MQMRQCLNHDYADSVSVKFKDYPDFTFSGRFQQEASI